MQTTISQTADLQKTLVPTFTTNAHLNPDLLLSIFSYPSGSSLITFSSVNKWARAAVLSDDFLSKITFDYPAIFILHPNRLPKKPA